MPCYVLLRRATSARTTQHWHKRALQEVIALTRHGMVHVGVQQANMLCIRMVCM
jgi:hypothetical protein